MPTKSICAIAGRSSTKTTSTSPSTSRRTSREEPGREEGADRLRGLLLGHGLADLDRQVAEDGAGLDALDALDADVLDDEGLEGEREASERSSPSSATRRSAWSSNQRVSP